MTSNETLIGAVAARPRGRRSNRPTSPGEPALPTPAGSKAATPKFKQIACILEAEISSGRYAIGALIPTEADLVTTHGVSRYTVRAALGELERLGLIQRRKGTRAIVSAVAPNRAFVLQLQALGDEVQHLPATLVIDRFERLHVSRASARNAGLERDGTWIRSVGVRRSIGSGAVVSHATIWLRPEFEGLVACEGPIQRPLLTGMQSDHGIRIERIEVVLRAGLLTQREQRSFNVAEPAACLRVMRRYFDDTRRIAIVKCDTYMADRFTYRVAFDREAGCP